MTFSLFLFYLFVFTLNNSSSSSTVIKLETTTNNKYKKAPSAAKRHWYRGTPMHSRRPMLEAIFQLRFLLSPFLYLCTIEPLTIKKHTSWQPVFRWHCSVVQLNKVFFRFRRKNKIRASKKRLHSGQCGQQQQYQSSGNEVAFIGSSNITVVQPKFLHKTWFFCCTTCCNNAEKLVLGRRRALNCSCTVLFRYFF